MALPNLNDLTKSACANLTEIIQVAYALGEVNEVMTEKLKEAEKLALEFKERAMQAEKELEECRRACTCGFLHHSEATSTEMEDSTGARKSHRRS